MDKLTTYALVFVFLISSSVVRSADKVKYCCDNTVNKEWLMKWGIIFGVGVAFTYFVLPVIVAMLGFGPAGIAVGTLAAALMRVVYGYGYGMALLAIMQSIGATGSAAWLVAWVISITFGLAVLDIISLIYNCEPDARGNCCHNHVNFINELSKAEKPLDESLSNVLVAFRGMCDLRETAVGDYLNKLIVDKSIVLSVLNKLCT